MMLKDENALKYPIYNIERLENKKLKIKVEVLSIGSTNLNPQHTSVSNNVFICFVCYQSQ